jgi:phosphoglycerate dehydrogenase-like enzyme
LQRRGLADRLALAAAVVFEREPLPADRPLTGRENVVHTPHIAGRSRDANEAWADAALAQFSRPRESPGSVNP